MQVCEDAQVKCRVLGKKLYGNRERDNRNQKELEDMGWKVITVWECELKKDKVERTLDELYVKITSRNMDDNL